MECPICQKPFNNMNGLAKHVHNQHKDYTRQSFYDSFLKINDSVGKCKTCNNPTTFRNIGKGYLVFCSAKCRSLDTDIRNNFALFAKGKKQSKETIRKRIANTNQTSKEQTRINTMQKKYGVTNPSYLPEHKDKCKQTSLKNWGTDYPTQNPNVFNRVKYKKRTVNINGHEFSDIQGYEDVFLQQLHDVFPNISYVDLLEERNKTLFRKNGSVHFPDFYSKKHNHMFEVKSDWTFQLHEEDVLLKKEEAEEQGYTYSIIVWKRRNSKPIVI